MRGNLPLYDQLKQYIINYIEENLLPDEKLPSENQLMDSFNVSRTTVRKALASLENEGLIYKRKGVGSFVKRNDNYQMLGNYMGFSEKMKQLGIKIEYESLKAEIVTASKMLALHLNINTNDPVFNLVRIGYYNESPINQTISYLPYNHIQEIEKFDFSELSLYSILESIYNIKILSVAREIEAIKADYKLSEALEIGEGIPLLKFNGLVTGMLSDKKVIIEYFHTYYRTDNIKFYIEEKAMH